MALVIGDSVLGCTILKELGAGATAAVYLVRHESSGGHYALKVLEHTSEDIRVRMVDEGEAQSRLKHPNIVNVHEILEIDGQPALLMDYIDGPSLEAVLESSGRLSLAAADGVAVGLLAAMAHAHAAGIIHRDLKPGNILLERSGALWIPKVADFGVAKILGRDEGRGRARTQTGSALGTPAYMAPEQIRDAKSIDVRADLYSLGTIFYEMLCGEPVFPGEDLLTIFSAVVSAQYEPLENRVPDLPDRMQTVVERCLSLDPDDRYPSCRVALEAWQAYAVPNRPIGIVKPTALAGVKDSAVLPPVGTALPTVLPQLETRQSKSRVIAALALVAVWAIVFPGMQVASGLTSAEIPDLEDLWEDPEPSASGELMGWLRGGDDGQSAVAWEIILSRWDAGIDDPEDALVAFATEGNRPRHHRAMEAVATRGDPWRLLVVLDHRSSNMRAAAIETIVLAAADTDREAELEPIFAERLKHESSLRVQRQLSDELQRIRTNHGRDYDGVPVRSRLR